MSKMRNFFNRNSPPGMELKQEWCVFLIGNIGSMVLSFLGFMGKYLEARRQLFTYFEFGKKELIEGAIITPFLNLLGGYLAGFFWVACFLLGNIVYHYTYYRQGSMSIYLMKRLPHKGEIHRRALVLPCLAILATIAVALATILFFYIIYILATPVVCLPYEALREIGR